MFWNRTLLKACSTCINNVDKCKNTRLLCFTSQINSISTVLFSSTRGQCTVKNEQESAFSPKKILLLRKTTRYEYEKQLKDISNSEEDIKDFVTSKGSDYYGLLQRHDEYCRSLEQIQENVLSRGLEIEVVRRHDYCLKRIEWADAIFTAGGDGTFLMAAAKVKGHGKPVIGINTDPIRSEGVLCLPKKYSKNIGEALDKLLLGKFKWMWRQRIRISMSGMQNTSDPVDLHDQELMYPEHRFWEHVQENEMYHKGERKDLVNTSPPRVLPILALNEVFVGESLSARVSFYEMSVNDSPAVKQKSSGVTVCTGTGSSSWYFNINHVPTQSINEVLQIAKEITGVNIDANDKLLAQKIVQHFSNSLRFDPRELKMAYSVRDPVPHGIFQVANPRGFCNKVNIKSRMWDAWVVVDGGLSFRFNDGAAVTMEMADEDSLRCVKLSK